MQVWTVVCGKTALDRLGEALQAVHHGNQDIAPTPRFFISFMTRSQNLAALCLLDPNAEDFLGAVRAGCRAQCRRPLLRTKPSSLILTRMASEEDQRIERVKRPVLPLSHFLQDGVGDGRDQIGRHVDAVELLQMATDLRAPSCRAHTWR